MCVYNFGAEMVPNDAYAQQNYEANNLTIGSDGKTRCGSVPIIYNQYNGPASSVPPRCRN